MNIKNEALNSRMPALFIGHGSPMNAITNNPYKDAWMALGRTLPRPNAILCVSAHWQTRGTQVCVAKAPRTIHDFGGFPAELFAQQYLAPGAPDYAEITRALLPNGIITGSDDWGLDHGAWTVLQSLFPEADIPVFQLSLDMHLDFAAHFALARQLVSLREHGVMVIGSGNVVHNLRLLNPQDGTPLWAINFDNYIKTALETSDDDALIHIERTGESAKLAVPSDEHYLPLLYVTAMRHATDNMHFLTEDFDLGSLSMRSVIYQ